MTTTRTTEPTVITQGDRAAWTKTFEDYSAADYDLEYRFRGQGIGFNVTATADGADFDAEITAAVSGAAEATKYAWQAWLTEQADATNTFCIETGETTVKRGFTTSATAVVDLRSAAKVALDAINAAISGKATSDMLEYEISTPAGSRKVKRMSMRDLLDARKEYAAIVANETARESARTSGTFGTRVEVKMYDE